MAVEQVDEALGLAVGAEDEHAALVAARPAGNGQPGAEDGSADGDEHHAEDCAGDHLTQIEAQVEDAVDEQLNGGEHRHGLHGAVDLRSAHRADACQVELLVAHCPYAGDSGAGRQHSAPQQAADAERRGGHAGQESGQHDGDRVDGDERLFEMAARIGRRCAVVERDVGGISVFDHQGHCVVAHWTLPLLVGVRRPHAVKMCRDHTVTDAVRQGNVRGFAKLSYELGRKDYTPYGLRHDWWSISLEVAT
jgi:hypothetical protein